MVNKCSLPPPLSASNFPQAKSKDTKPATATTSPPTSTALSSTSSSPAPVPQVPTAAAPADFDSWYLKQVTTEFADDLDKIRNASDFKDGSVPILVTALRQGVGIYSAEEKERVMESVRKGV